MLTTIALIPPAQISEGMFGYFMHLSHGKILAANTDARKVAARSE
jgi:hypothetical protein